MNIPRMLTINELAAECKGTGMTAHCIRQLALQDKIIHIRAGNKILINADKFVEYLNNPTPLHTKNESGKIRRIPERQEHCANHTI